MRLCCLFLRRRSSARWRKWTDWQVAAPRTQVAVHGSVSPATTMHPGACAGATQMLPLCVLTRTLGRFRCATLPVCPTHPIAIRAVLEHGSLPAAPAVGFTRRGT